MKPTPACDGPRGTVPRTEPAVRPRAASVLGHFDDSVALPILIPLLAADAPKLAATAAGSLGWRCSLARVEPLLKALEERGPPVKVAAHNSLVLLWSDCMHLAHIRADADSAPARMVERLVAPGEELERIVGALDSARSRITAALDVARRLPDLPKRFRGGLTNRCWARLSLSDRIDLCVEGGRSRERRPEDEAKEPGLRRRAAAYRESRPEAAASTDRLFEINLPAAVRALPDDREYGALELTRLIARVNRDPSARRRKLIDEGWMVRRANLYRLTDLGRCAWKVERRIAGQG